MSRQQFGFAATDLATSLGIAMQAPAGQFLAPGYFPRAQRWQPQATSLPGLDVGWNHRGCNQLSGRFIVGQAVVDASGNLQKFHATFEQHCERRSPALRGTIWIDMEGSTTPPPAPVLPAVTTPVTRFTYTSDPGDVLGGGSSGSFTLANAVFGPTAQPSDASVHIAPASGPAYYFQFKAPSGQLLTVGTYDPATNNLSSPGPVVFFTGLGNCSGTVNGKFIIDDYTYGTNALYSFHVTFELRCGASTAAFRGDLRVMADPWR